MGIASTIVAGTSTASTSSVAAGVTAVIAQAGAAGAASAGGGGLSAAALSALPSGPIGWVVVGGVIVGAELDDTNLTATWDCWKAIVHDNSTEASNGMLLENLISDHRVEEWHIQGDTIRLLNIWGEEFELKRALLPWDVIALHAHQLKAALAPSAF